MFEPNRRANSIPEVAPHESKSPAVRSSHDWQIFCNESNIRGTYVVESYEMVIFSRHFESQQSAQSRDPIVISVDNFAQSLVEFSAFKDQSRALFLARAVSTNNHHVIIEDIKSYIDKRKPQFETLVGYVKNVVSFEINKIIYITKSANEVLQGIEISPSRSGSHVESEKCDSEKLVVRKPPQSSSKVCCDSYRAMGVPGSSTQLPKVLPKNEPETSNEGTTVVPRKPLLRVLTRSFTRSLSATFKGPGIGFFKRLFSRGNSTVPTNETEIGDEEVNLCELGAPARHTGVVVNRKPVEKQMSPSAERQVKEYMELHDMSWSEREMPRY
jgi:hypothetical protein